MDVIDADRDKGNIRISKIVDDSKIPILDFNPNVITVATIIINIDAL